MMSHTEYETSVRLLITEKIFSLLYNKFYNENCKKILITYFNDPTLMNHENTNSNQGYRITNNVFQYKQCSHRINLLKILINKNDDDDDINDHAKKKNKIMFIPYSRTTATENIAELTRKFNTIRDITIRFIIYQQDNIRISLEKKSEGHHGGSFYFTAEIEYGTDYSLMNYKQLTDRENFFWDLLSTTYLSEFYHLIDSNSMYNYVQLTQLLHIPCRKFSSFYEYSCNMSNYKLKYKFDGYKGRMINNNVKPNSIFYWDDMHNTGKIESPFLNDFPHIIFQYEVIANKRWIIFTDIIGAIVNKQLYMPEPNDVLALFAQFPRQGVNTPLLADDYPHRTLLFDPLNVNLNQNSTDNEFTIGVQFIITDNNGSCLLAPPLSNTDGFIVVCNNREYKFKIPTLDVRIRNELAYLDQSPMPIFNTKLLSTFLLNPNSVYEITLRKNQVIILRERFERQFTSNMDEFENFKKELAFMSRQLQLMN